MYQSTFNLLPGRSVKPKKRKSTYNRLKLEKFRLKTDLLIAKKKIRELEEEVAGLRALKEKYYENDS